MKTSTYPQRPYTTPLPCPCTCNRSLQMLLTRRRPGTATGTVAPSPGKISRGCTEMVRIYIYRKENSVTAGSPATSLEQTEQLQEIQSATGHADMEQVSPADCLSSVIVPRTASTRDITVLETAMQGLALDARHPVALELAATSTSRHFLLRATSSLALQHLQDQVRARYPQALISSILEQDDPL